MKTKNILKKSYFWKDLPKAEQKKIKSSWADWEGTPVEKSIWQYIDLDDSWTMIINDSQIVPITRTVKVTEFVDLFSDRKVEK